MKKFTRRSREFVTKIKTSLTSVSKSSRNDVKNSSKNESKPSQNIITTSSDNSSHPDQIKPELKLLEETKTDIKFEKSNQATEKLSKKITSPLSTKQSDKSCEYSQDYNDVDSGLTRTPQNADFFEEIKAPEECKLKKTNPLLELLKPTVIHKSSSLQFQGPSQGLQVKQVNSINVSERQVNSFFEIFNHEYVKDFFKCDSCFLLSDKYRKLKMGEISILNLPFLRHYSPFFLSQRCGHLPARPIKNRPRQLPILLLHHSLHGQRDARRIPP